MSAVRALRRAIPSAARIPRASPPPHPPPPSPSSAAAAAAPPSLSCSLQSDIARLATQRGTPLTVRELYNVGQRARDAPAQVRLTSAQWLHGELPIRLAHRVRELSELPHGLARMPSVVAVRSMYEASVRDLLSAPAPTTRSREQAFSGLLGAIRARHDDVVKLMAKGVIELKEDCGKGGGDIEIRSFLDRFYMSRIGIRVLISHHLALVPDGAPGMAGVINTACRPAALIDDAVNATRSLCYSHFGEAPPVEMRGNVDLAFPYVDNHLFLCLFELLKNSLRATVETHRDADVLPPVRVIVADGQEDVTIKISDEGGGLCRSELRRVWSYLFTTAKLPAKELLALEDNQRAGGGSTNRPDPIAGFGYGLPLSRLYARYWGGELALSSMEGYGTDAYLHLSKLGDRKECRTAFSDAPPLHASEA